MGKAQRIREKADKEKSVKRKKAAGQEVVSKKRSAQNAKGTPCDRCHSKCKSHTCKAWCNAHWCTGSSPKSNLKKEVIVKLQIAKRQQADAAVAMKTSQKTLQSDIASEKKATRAAQ